MNRSSSETRFFDLKKLERRISIKLVSFDWKFCKDSEFCNLQGHKCCPPIKYSKKLTITRGAKKQILKITHANSNLKTIFEKKVEGQHFWLCRLQNSGLYKVSNRMTPILLMCVFPVSLNQ